jgi:hypothetical protein
MMLRVGVVGLSILAQSGVGHAQTPQARMHTQWPGTGRAGDPIVDQFHASQVPYLSQAKPVQTLNRDTSPMEFAQSQ